MSTSRPPRPPREVDHLTGDGKPVAETPIHRANLLESIRDLQNHFAGQEMIDISRNMFLDDVEGDKRKHVSPDVFVVRGIPDIDRDAYFLWQEGKGPDLVIEMTSRTTRKEDTDKKWALYRDVLRVGEYFLFDPKAEDLKPPLQGYRLVEGQSLRIEPVDGRLPSAVPGLHLEGDGRTLRFCNPATGRWIPKERENWAAYDQAKAALEQSEAARRAVEDELQRLRQEIEDLRRPAPDVS